MSYTGKEKPRLLDLFCGAGGAGMGYARAGFEVVGVDVKPQPRYPFAFIQGDALRPPVRLDAFDAIHASPPCQGYSRLRHLPWLKDRKYPLLIDPIRDMLQASGKPYVIENVEDAPLPNSAVLCGRMFGLPVFRHRRFETSFLLMTPQHRKHDQVIGSGRMVNDRRKAIRLNRGSSKGTWGTSNIVTVAGGQFRKADGERALDINWMTVPELAEAIPPAFTEFIGRALMEALERAA